MAMTKNLKELVELQEATVAPRVIESGIRDISAMDEIALFIRLGRLTASGFTDGVKFRVEVSPDESGNRWFSLTALESANGASIGSEAVNGACLANQKVVPMASTTGFVVGDIIYIDNTVTANSEFGRIKAVSANVSVTLEDNLENVQTGSTAYDQAEIYTPLYVDVRASARVRVVVDGKDAAQNFAVEVAMMEMRG